MTGTPADWSHAIDLTRFLLVGPGRAGTALALVLAAAGHRPVGVVARRPEAAATAAARLRTDPVPAGAPLPAADLVVVAVRDDAIAEVAAGLAARGGGPVTAAIHLSGLVPVAALAPLQELGAAIGSFHPLQTIPTPEAGAARLAGAWVAVTTEAPGLAAALEAMAETARMRPFPLRDDAKAVYHAAAAAAANFPVANLAMAADLFEAAGVPFPAARPLVEAVVANAFELGPRDALTGPVARGDRGTVATQVAAVRATAPNWLPAFLAAVGELARIAGREDEFAGVGA